MFDISTRLVSEQDEISGLETIGWENHSWKYLSLIRDERVINLQRTKVYVFSDSVLCHGKIFENPQSNDAWEQRLGWFKSFPVYRNFDRIDGEPMEFEWNIFPRFNTLQLSEEVKSLLLRLGETPENFTGRIIFMSMFNDISCGSRDNEKECELNARLVSLFAKGFGKGQGSFIGLFFLSGTLSVKIVHKDNGTIWRKGCCWNSQKADVQFSVLQVHCLEVDSKAKVMENCRYTVQLIWKRLRLFFAQLFLQISSVFTEQSQKCVKSTKPFTTDRGDPLWEGNQVACMVNTELRSEFRLWTETILTPGSEFLMDRTSLWWIWTTMSRQFQKFSSKNMRYNWMRRILHADQRLKQNHKEENLSALHQEQFLLRKELGPMLNQGNIHSPIMKYRKNWFIFFVMDKMCIEKMMERFNSRQLKEIFRNISCLALIGLIASGRKAWQEEEETRKYISAVLILLEQLCISELFKDIQDAVLYYRSFVTWQCDCSEQFLPVHLSCRMCINLHSIINSGLIPGRQNFSNRQTVFFLPVDPMDKNHKDPDTIDLSVPRHDNTCIKHGRDIKTRYVGSILILLWGKDWSSIRLDRTPSFFMKHFQLIVFRKLFGWKLEKTYTKKYTCHLGLLQRSPWNTNGKENLVQNMLNVQKLGSYLEVSNRANQFQTQVVIDRGNPLLEPIDRGNPLLELTREPCKMEEKRPVPKRSM